MLKEDVVVVNDCSNVIHDLLPHLTKHFNVQLISRTRGLWSKTFGLALKIVKADATLFHVNYALQDAFIVRKLKHLDVLHCHGSDVRWVMHSLRWGWLVRSNLKNAKKIIFSTPDLLSCCKNFVDDPLWLPNPVDTRKFKPVNKPVTPHPKAVYFEKWYEKLPLEIPNLCRKHGLNLTIMPLGTRLSYNDMPEFLSKFDVYIDRFIIGSNSKTSLEAMSCGLAKIPAPNETLEHSIRRYSNTQNCRRDGERNREYVLKQHNAERVASLLTTVWRNLIYEKWN